MTDRKQNGEIREKEIPEEKIPAEAEPKGESHAEEVHDGDCDVSVKEEEEKREEERREQDEREEEEAIRIPDLEPLGLEELYNLTRKLIQEHPVQRIREHVELIRHHFFTKAKAEWQEKLEAFTADGGVEADFKFRQPIRDSFKQLTGTYRKELQAYLKDLEKRLNENLRLREEVIGAIRGLLQSEEKFSETFQHFRELQKKWRSIGPVPRAESSEIWRVYHHHVENFYDYLHLNDELRDLDFKKNLEQKQRLIGRTRELVQKDDVHEASRELQKLHREWKEEGGPVAKEYRETIWETFSELTRQVHGKRHAYFDKLREQWEEHLKLRENICRKIEKAAKEDIKSHQKWQEKIREVRTLVDAFREVGHVPRGKSSEIWQRFRKALHAFNHARNEFYRTLQETYKENLAQRKVLIEKVEALKDSEDWKGTAEAVKKLQFEWKKIGPVTHSENQKTWKEFHTACDHFFSRRKAHFKAQDKQCEDNYIAKEKLMAELEAYDPGADTSKAMAKLDEFTAKWRGIGFVPRNRIGINKDWVQLMDSKFDQLKLSGKEKSLARFRNKIGGLVAKGGGELDREKNQVCRELNRARDELQSLEANIQMLSPTGNKDNPLVAQVEKSIGAQKGKIEKLREKMLLIREVEKSEAAK